VVLDSGWAVPSCHTYINSLTIFFKAIYFLLQNKFIKKMQTDKHLRVFLLGKELMQVCNF